MPIGAHEIGEGDETRDGEGDGEGDSEGEGEGEGEGDGEGEGVDGKHSASKKRSAERSL